VVLKWSVLLDQFTRKYLYYMCSMVICVKVIRREFLAIAIVTIVGVAKAKHHV